MNKILFLGTSHTSGECKRAHSNFLNKEDTWTHLLAEKLKQPYTRLSRGGVDNYQLGIMLLSYKENLQQEFDNYSTIVVEARIGTEWPLFPAEQFNIPLMTDLIQGNAYETGYEFGSKNTHVLGTDWPTYGGQEELIDMCISKDDRILLKQLLETNDLYRRCSAVYKKTIYELVYIHEICKLLNKEFYWFSFANNVNMENENYQLIDSVLRKEYKSLFDCNISPNGIRDELRFFFDDPSECTCGHFDETRQMPIAEHLFESIVKHRNTLHK